MTLHPDEQAREFFSSRGFSRTQGNGTLSYRDIEALAALLIRVRLAEAEWWAKEAGHDTIPTNSHDCKICERIASLWQATGEG